MANAWLGSVPYGGYQDGGPYGSAPSPYGAASPYAPYGGAPPPGPMVDPNAVPTGPQPGESKPFVSVLALTALGLAAFGGGGALVGWLLGGTQRAALVGAIFGLATPPMVSAIQYERRT